MQLKEKIKSRNFKDAFKNEDGAIDLASIMVGIIVIGIIGGVIAATIFAVIPWSQDNGAKAQLDNVATAESAYRGLAADSGATAFGAYDGSTELKSTTGSILLAKNIGDLKIVTGKNSAGDPCYVASITSASGNKFYATDKTKASRTAPADTCTAASSVVTYTITGNKNIDAYNNDAVNEQYTLKDSNGNAVSGATWSISKISSGGPIPDAVTLNSSTGLFSGYPQNSNTGEQEGTVVFDISATKDGVTTTVKDVTLNWSYFL